MNDTTHYRIYCFNDVTSARKDADKLLAVKGMATTNANKIEDERKAVNGDGITSWQINARGR